MTSWSVTVEASGEGSVDLELLEDLLDVLGDLAPVVIAPPEEPADGMSRYGADLTITARDAIEAAHIASDRFNEAIYKLGLPSWPLSRVTILSEAELDASISVPNFPLLLGVSELADTLGVSKQRASELARVDSFPQPVVMLASGPVWTEPTIRRYVESWARRPGRPPKQPASGRH
jgi:hypothetical protein